MKWAVYAISVVGKQLRASNVFFRTFESIVHIIFCATLHNLIMYLFVDFFLHEDVDYVYTLPANPETPK